MARVVAREATVAGLLVGTARAVSEAWGFERVVGFEARAGIAAPAAAEGWELVHFDGGRTGGVAIARSSPLADEVRAGVAEVVLAAGLAVSRAVEAAARERFARYTEPLAEAVMVFDADTFAVAHTNDAMARLRGFASVAEAGADLGWTPRSRAFLERVLPRRRTAFEGGERRRYVDEVAHVHKGGHAVWAEVESFLQCDEVTGSLLVCARARPLDHGGLLEELQELALIGAWSVDPVTAEGPWTSQLAKIHDVPIAFDMGDALSRFAPAEQALLMDRMTKTSVTGEPCVVEVPITTGRGERKWVRVHARGVTEHGAVVRIRGTAQDITPRKETELALAAQRAHLQCLLDHIPDIVSLRDPDHRVLACNARLERLLGVGPGELIGRALPDATPVSALLEKDLREERWLTFADDGHRELVETLTALVRGPDGAVLGILEVSRDVTAARTTEEQLRAAQKMEAIGRLAGGVAHDFNNLLSVILSYTNLAIETLPPQHPLQEDFAEIIAAGKRGESLTRQLLTFSRRQLLQMTPLVLRDVVDTTGQMLGRLIGEDIELRFVHDGEPAAAKVDRGQLEQVLVNLVVNARDAMPSGGRLTISTARVTIDEAESSRLDLPPGSYVCLSVEDTGVGMDSATLARAFEPFFTTKGLGKGTGLGLATAYGIVKQSGGAITITSAPSAGTTVRLYLPQHVGATAASSPKPPAVNRAGGAETVLVVEDEGPLRTVARRILRAAGYEVLVASNAEEALRIAHEVGDSIDLVFTDVVMPGMNGGELVERLVAMFPTMRILITSGYTDEKLAKSGVGEHRFLAKPYEPAQLVDAIRAVLDATDDDVRA